MPTRPPTAAITDVDMAAIEACVAALTATAVAWCALAGYTLRAEMEVSEHGPIWVEIDAFEVTGGTAGEAKPERGIFAYDGEPGMVRLYGLNCEHGPDPANSEHYLKARLKWDGCSDWWYGGDVHHCGGGAGIRRHAALLLAFLAIAELAMTEFPRS